MEVSPKTLREVEFREKKVGGYHHEDVDQFLEQVAVGIEVLHDRLRQAVERAQRAEAAASEAGGTDETLRRTLVLAQRTADLAVQEAREQAARILAGAEQQAQAMITDAEESGRRTFEDSVAEARAELGRLEAQRVGAQQDVDNLCRWLDEHRAHIRVALEEALDAVERSGIQWPAPSTRPIEVPGAAQPGLAQPAPVAATAQAATSQAASAQTAGSVEGADGPDTRIWSPEEQDLALTSVQADAIDVDEGGTGFDGPDDRAMDSFFENGEEELAGDHRFGGRLRRKR